MITMLKARNLSQAAGRCIAYFKMHPVVLRFIIFGILYFFIRCGWQGSIEFGYDPGRLSSHIVDILNKKDFANAPQYIIDNIGGGSIAWGPVFFYTMFPFFLITRDPLIITNMLIVVQFLGIIAMYFIVEMLYNRRVAFFSTMFLIAFPWHVIFSRMLYNPSLLLFSIPLVMLVTLLIVKKGKQKLLLILPFLWLSMIQYHFVGLVILALSLAYLVVHFKKIKWRYFRVGLLISIIALLPIITFDMKNDFAYTRGFLGARNSEADPNNNPAAVVKTVIDDTVSVSLLTDFGNHLGYSVDAFFKKIPSIYNVFHPLYAGLLLVSVVFFLAKIFWKPKVDDILVLSWYFCVALFLFVFNYNNSQNITITQRYFIPAFFPIGILIGSTLDNIIKFIITKIRFRNLKINTESVLNISSYIASSLFVYIFFIFTITYHTFIIDFDYPEVGHLGWLGWDSGPPYLFTHDAIDYALKEAKKEGFDTIVVSDNWRTKDRFNMNNYQEYIWQHVYKKQFDYDEKLPFYFICMGPRPHFVREDEIKQFGPWRVSRKKSAATCSPEELVSMGEGKIFSLISSYCEKTFDIMHSQKDDGSPAIAYDYFGFANQCLHLVETGEPGVYYLFSEHSEKHIDIGPDNRIVINPPNDNKSQRWRLDIHGQLMRIISEENGYAIAIQNSSPENYTPIIAEPQSDRQNQLWKVLYY